MHLINSQTAFLFPGQGSQKVGMGRELAQAYPAALEVFQRADQHLGFPLSKLMWEGPESELNDTVNTQPALFVHSMAALAVLQQLYPSLSAKFTAGHSMGELSALAASQALSFESALTLVRERGRLMKEAGQVSPGGMAAIMGLDIPTLDKICAEASLGDEVVQVANDNCPGQVVVSGAKAAMERLLPLAQQSGARRVIPLAVSIAAHSPLMAYAQEKFTQAVEAAHIDKPRIPIVGNVSACPMFTPEQVHVDLCGQLLNRVRWTESVQAMQKQGISTYIEVGSGSVLCGLIKRIDSSAASFPFGVPADIENLTKAVE